MHFFARTTISICLATLLAAPAVAADPKASRYYEDALARYEKKDLAGAIIQLKNALQLDRTMLAAQLLMGKASLANSDLPAAEAAFEEALKLGVSRAEVMLPLGQVYLLQGKYETLLDRITTNDLPIPLQADVLVLRSNAQSSRGNRSTAEKMLDEARTLSPNSVGVRLAQVALYIRSGDLARATDISDETIKLDPKDPNVWNTRASIQHVKGDLPGALASYGKAIETNPKFVDARIARAGLYLDLGKLDDAKRDLATLNEVAPDEPRAAYLRSVIATQKGDLDSAKTYLTQIVDLLDPVPAQVLSANRQMLLLAGLAHYGLRNREKATGYLTAYLRQFPGDPSATKLLATLYLEQGDSTRVISLLEPVVRANPNEARALAILANAYMQERNFRKASELLDRAVKNSGGEGEMRTDLGLSLMGTGRQAEGLDQLQQVFAKDPKQARAALALATLSLRSGQAKRAQDVLEKLLKADPTNLTAMNLLGVAKEANGDRAGARRAYEQTLIMDPGYQSASLNIARLDLADGKIDVARQRLTKMLQNDSKSVETMIELAKIEESAGSQKEAVRWLEKARDEPQGAVVAGNLLVAMHMRFGNGDQALSVAKDVVARAPDNLAALASLARVQLSAGDRRSARQTLGDMARYANYNAEAQVEIAQLQIAAGNDSGAVYSLEKALSARPDFAPALVTFAEVNTRQKDYARAEERIRQLAERYPTGSVAPRLQGDLALARNQFPAAIASYNTALKRENSAEIALRIYRAHVMAGEAPKALAFLEKWNREAGDNPVAMRVIAEAHLRNNNLPAARNYYERLVKLSPKDPGVLNNLAVTALKQDDKAALAFAERAFKLRPNESVFIDTMGWTLFRQGQVEQGLALLRDARLRDGNNPEIRYHLAAALQKTGRTSEAKEEISKALQSGIAFDGMEDAKKLSVELNKVR